MSVPLGDTEPAHLLAELKRRDIVCSARDGHLRLAIHLYNHEDDIGRLASALSDAVTHDHAQAACGPVGSPASARDAPPSAVKARRDRRLARAE